MPPIYFNPEAITETMENAICCQEMIGWNQLLKGKISENWVKAQEEYFRRKDEPLKFNGDTWAQKLVSYLIDFGLTI